MKLQFKFQDAVSGEARDEVLRTLIARGAAAVQRLFPDEDDAELASLYVVDCEDASTGRALLQLLRASKLVQFAEQEARRKLREARRKAGS